MTNWIWSIELNTDFRLKYQFQLFFTFLQVMDQIFQSKFFASQHVRSAIEVKLNQFQCFRSDAIKMMMDFIFIFHTVLTKGPTLYQVFLVIVFSAIFTFKFCLKLRINTVLTAFACLKITAKVFQDYLKKFKSL